jgi:hypothetical protein
MECTKAEAAYLNRIRTRLEELRTYLNALTLDEDSAEVHEWYAALAKVKAIQGNMNNDLSFVACLMAKQYLRKHFGVTSFDAAAKPQGASGLDIDVVTPSGERVVGEIKTTVPYSGAVNDLGAKQKEMFRKDFKKLNAADAAHKFFFVTDRATLAVVERRYLNEIPGVKVVFLDLERALDEG